MFQTITLTLQTHGHTAIHDLTPEVAQAVSRAGLQTGLAALFTPSSTSALTTIEYEAGALADLRRALDEIAPPHREYQHNLKWGDGNGAAHLRAALLGPSLTVPIVQGRLGLGVWQQIVFLDFDNRPRQREVLVQLCGE